ncbi:DMT family transporter [Brevibacterium linens]|uniref:Transporter family-2 protein n=1 Tax=Brevibacterium linens TaxID=1703 RepID=A0A2H1HPH0_BRELN|nr:DMT family transporter [Brevibacterium linens]SMX64828.1 transporter family-2 protein [Brevibacterium linens]
MRSPSLVPVLTAGLVTIAAGAAMSLQGRANGLLGLVLGHAVFAALISFLVGLLCVGIALAVSARSRTSARRLVGLLRDRSLPWWMLLGGLSGGLVVIAQATTIPLMGVAMFTMAFVSGQITGGLIVDSTELPPGGRQRLNVLRILGVLIVLASLAFAAGDRLQSGIPLWTPLLPFVSGALTSVQQAFNGHIRAATESAVVATTVNFTVGFAALVIGTVVLLMTGVAWRGFPTAPDQWWILLGGAFGVVFIALTTVTVARLGVLLLSLFALFGNLVGALALDALLPIPGSEVTLITVVSAVGVLIGIVVTILPVPVRPSSGNRRGPASRT